MQRYVHETALIYLNEKNAETLNLQLQRQHHISIKEFEHGVSGMLTTITRYDRTNYLQLPKIDFYQLKISYNTIIIDENKDTENNIANSYSSATISVITKEVRATRSLLLRATRLLGVTFTLKRKLRLQAWAGRFFTGAVNSNNKKQIRAIITYLLVDFFGNFGYDLFFAFLKLMTLESLPLPRTLLHFGIFLLIFRKTGLKAYIKAINFKGKALCNFFMRQPWLFTLSWSFFWILFYCKSNNSSCFLAATMVIRTTCIHKEVSWKILSCICRVNYVSFIVPY